MTRLRRWGLALLMLGGCLSMVFSSGVNSAAPSGDAADATRNSDLDVATFAGGCFWCMEHPFDKLDGVVSTVSGYTGGHRPNPSYREVSAGGTGHAEAVQITYDPTRVSYEELLRVFWRNIDPVTANRQFCDAGRQYRSAVFYHDEDQSRLAQATRDALEQSGRLPGPIVTEIVSATTFYPAETYHQDYYRKNPIRYKYYRYACGRDQRLEELWGTDGSQS